MKKMNIRIAEDTVIEVAYDDTRAIVVNQEEPDAFMVQDVLDEMYEDIGTFDKEYFKELFADNSTFYVT